MIVEPWRANLEPNCAQNEIPNVSKQALTIVLQKALITACNDSKEGDT